MADDTLTIDCGGLSCPEPALMTKEALTTSDARVVEVLVDSVTSRDNVLRTGKRVGWEGEWEARQEGGFRLVFRK
jgi:TusA-related sulfurtransferase